MRQLRPSDANEMARLRARIGALSRGGQHALAARLLGQLSSVESRLGLTAHALRRARQASALAEVFGTPAQRIQALLRLGVLLLRRGLSDSALQAAREASARIAALSDEEARAAYDATARWLCGVACRQAGDPAGARRALVEAQGAFAATGDAASAARCLLELGLVDLDDGARERSRLCFQHALAMARAAQRGLAVELGAVIVEALWRERAWDELVELLSELRVDAHGDELRRLESLAAELRARQLRHRALEADQALAQAMDAALAGRSTADCSDWLDRTVSGLVNDELPASSWKTLQKFARACRERGWPQLAALATQALTQLGPVDA
jgi:tetratricopeptide (TPR) repeat protein